MRWCQPSRAEGAKQSECMCLSRQSLCGMLVLFWEYNGFRAPDNEECCHEGGESKHQRTCRKHCLSGRGYPSHERHNDENVKWYTEEGSELEGGSCSAGRRKERDRNIGGLTVARCSLAISVPRSIPCTG